MSNKLKVSKCCGEPEDVVVGRGLCSGCAKPFTPAPTPKKERKIKECERCKEYREQLKHEMNEANVLAEFIRRKDLCEEYVKWSRPKFKRLDKSNEKPSNK